MPCPSCVDKQSQEAYMVHVVLAYKSTMYAL